MHPLAWWAWALGLAAAATQETRTPVVFALLVVVVVVVLTRRGSSPWARSFPAYLVLGGCIVAARVLFHVLVGIKGPGTVVLDLPRVTLPEWAVGVQLLGPVTTTGLGDAAAGGLRLATLVVCFGAANALANPKRALRCLPASLHHLGTAVVIAVSMTPQLVSSAADVRRAQRLRGWAPRGMQAVRATAVPVLTDALDRSLALAASMDSRGYARTLRAGSDRRVGALALLALVAAAIGSYGLLGGNRPALGGLMLGCGALAGAVASVLAGRRVNRTRYRPDPWRTIETVVAACGVATMALLAVAALTPTPGPAQVLVLSLTALLLAVAPAFLRPGVRP